MNEEVSPPMSTGAAEPGPAVKADARYMAVDSRDLSRQYTFRLFPDGSGTGAGPDGVTHARFRLWKESLRDAD